MMEEAEARKKMIEALEAGRVEWSPAGKEYFERAGVISDKPDFTVVSAKVDSFWGPWHKDDRGNQGGMEIGWSTVSAGFGSLTLTIADDGTLQIDSECMGKEFCKSVLMKLIDSIDDEQFRR